MHQNPFRPGSARTRRGDYSTPPDPLRGGVGKGREKSGEDRREGKVRDGNGARGGREGKGKRGEGTKGLEERKKRRRGPYRHVPLQPQALIFTNIILSVRISGGFLISRHHQRSCQLCRYITL